MSYFRRYGRGLVSTPAISLKKSWGGYRRMTPEVERLVRIAVAWQFFALRKQYARKPAKILASLGF